MKTAILLILLPLVFYAGCTGLPSASTTPAGPQPCTRYGSERVDIIPLTSLVHAPDAGRNPSINAYVCLLDSFDSQIKAPAVFRFELFEQLQRSADPKGKRLVIWPDIDLTDPAINNNHWQDFLRAYLFSLPLEKPPADTCILHITCFCPSGKRLYADFLIKPAR
ncbi:MAG: hypothetical protein ABSG82_02415 [Sedimentisphaerales bacterium]